MITTLPHRGPCASCWTESSPHAQTQWDSFSFYPVQTHPTERGTLAHSCNLVSTGRNWRGQGPHVHPGCKYDTLVVRSVQRENRATWKNCFSEMLNYLRRPHPVLNLYLVEQYVKLRFLVLNCFVIYRLCHAHVRKDISPPLGTASDKKLSRAWEQG